MYAPATDRPFRRWQQRIFVVAWLSYASFYLCRVNIAIALPAIRADLGWDTGTVGWIGSAFLWIYALGQLVNGTLAQRVNARWFVGTGMLASALCNAAMGACSDPWAMMALWGINGWVQSMGWGAIMKTLSAWFDSRRRGRITALFGPCFVLGHLVAWTVGGWLVDRAGWRMAFWLPAGFFALMAAVWWVGIRSSPDAAGLRPTDGRPTDGRSTDGRHVPAPRSVRETLGFVLSEPRLRWAALTCVFASMVKDGLNLWMPTFLVDSWGMELDYAAWAASILPLLGLAGVLLAGWLSDRFFRSREAPGIMGMSLLIALVMGVFLGLGGRGSGWTWVLLGLCGMAVYGINALLLTSFPLSFGRRAGAAAPGQNGSVSAVAGFLDFASYVGGGISSLAIGQLLARSDWSAVFAYWLVATLIAFGGAAALARHTSDRRLATEVAERG